MTPISILEQFLQENPDIEMFEVLLHDLNGVQRGKWLPRDKIHKLFTGGYKMPLVAVHWIVGVAIKRH